MAQTRLLEALFAWIPVVEDSCSVATTSGISKQLLKLELRRHVMSHQSEHSA